MKTINMITGLLVVGLIFFTSCEKMLDIDQHGTASLESYYQTDEEADEAITSLYVKMMEIHFNDVFLKNLLSDDVWCGGGGRGDNNELEQLNEYTFGPEHSYIQSVFQGYYSVIYLSNVVLGHVPDASDIQKRARAEAKVFRAFAYINLISMWGTPPLVDHELGPSEYQQPNGNPAELWALVEADLTEAIASGVLAEKSGANDDANYRLTKQFAQSLLGKAYVFQEKWTDAAQVLDDVVRSGKYALYNGKYGDMLTYMQPNNCESVFELNRLNDPNNAFTNWSLEAAMLGWRGSVMNITSEVNNEAWGFINFNSELYHLFVQEEGEDGYRLNETMKTYDEVKELGDYIIDGKSLYGHEGYFKWKNRILKGEFISGGWMSSYNNLRYMRYAEVLLLGAEAQLKSNNVAKATEYVNQIRTRAKLPAKSTVTMDDIVLEKRLELCGEYVRYQDIIRWGIADKMKDQGKQIPSFTSSGSVNWEEYNTGDNAGFKEKHWLLPFPEVEISLNSNITQNPGW
ncbi:MAG: RagB/SusD family nutrient uptake outer membrane protein [Prolixibacteraceae bacterium]|nr:RagB/SusD family nutrient uptake outer membrane protein [Prolixibacteraceae bacterium]